MPYEIQAIEKRVKTSSDGTSYSYKIIHCAYEKEGVIGYCVENFYCGPNVDVSGFNIGDKVLFLYNKYGKIAEIRAV